VRGLCFPDEAARRFDERLEPLRQPHARLAPAQAAAFEEEERREILIPLERRCERLQQTEKRFARTGRPGRRLADAVPEVAPGVVEERVEEPGLAAEVAHQL
jgi:hypothetical protein